MIAAARRKWFALALLLGVQFMVVLDIAIVNVALPSIQTDLGFTQENLQWVVSAYALLFGGFLLLGGRVADIVGRRRVFVAGLVVFTAASLISGLAWSEASLIAARGLQGLGAALITPAALSILSTTFAEGKERNAALGAWGAVGAFGAVAGVLLGGVLTDALSWEWIFFVNVPVGIAGLALAFPLLNESRDAAVNVRRAWRGARHRWSGHAITQANDLGWTSIQTVGLSPARSRSSSASSSGSSALAADVVLDLPDPHHRCERRRVDPRHGDVLDVPDADALHAAGARGGDEDRRRVPGRCRDRDPLVGGGGAARQPDRRQARAHRRDVRSDARAAVLHAGVAAEVVCGRPAPRLPADRGGARLLVRADLDRGARRRAGVEQGLASGLINTSQQIGGAVGIAVLTYVATSTTDDAVSTGTAVPVALTDGFQAAFLGAAAIAFVGVLVALFLVRREDLVQQEPEVDAVPALGPRKASPQGLTSPPPARGEPSSLCCGMRRVRPSGAPRGRGSPVAGELWTILPPRPTLRSRDGWGTGSCGRTDPAFRNWLRQLRERAGLTQDQLAAAVGTDRRNIRRWEIEGHDPAGTVLLRILDAVGVELVPQQPPNVPRAVNADSATSSRCSTSWRTNRGQHDEVVALLKQDASATRARRAKRATAS